MIDTPLLNAPMTFHEFHIILKINVFYEFIGLTINSDSSSP